ncbi:efflux transporter outer membrane subunit [uncultured Oxalicibacterium sp.]|uniref:efflux transporter outer membrane subunit n=1 Tax=uncultured Oxalicibacterium sp. TaxID=1168540 RepID=UPI0025ECCCB2|nr:efflux transporter outer membrane subunit [uncultured Oxalicibacterium sp.]
MKKTSFQKSARVSALLAVLILAGCSTARPPEKVELEAPAQYREQAAQLDGAWKVAVPSDYTDRGNWWRVFGSTELNGLIDSATESNPNLAIALARVKEARAAAGVTDADRGVQASVGVGPTRSGNAESASTTYRAPLSFSYEVDLFGRLSDASRAARLDAQAQEAAYRSVLLALQADVAQLYFTIRALDAEMDVLQKTVTLRQEALDLAQRRFNAGDTSELDVAQARTEWATTSAELEGVTRDRTQRDHALAILLGKAPAEFTLVSSPLNAPLVTVPAGLPSDLLERRPDIAQAQRQLAAASARIGAAKAAFFPRLILTGSAGYESNELRDLFKWSSRSWVLGPVVGTMLSMPILDGGRNRANLARADAGYEALVANYRQQVLTGFREVEDNLAALRTLDRQMAFEDQAISSAQLASRLADSRYRNGSASYFEVIDAQRSNLASQRARVRSAGQRAVASVGLIRALGGGWGASSASHVAPAIPET